MQETRRKIRSVEEAPMRLIRQGDRFVAQFSFVWEVSTLAEREEGKYPTTSQKKRCSNILKNCCCQSSNVLHR